MYPNLLIEKEGYLKLNKNNCIFSVHEFKSGISFQKPNVGFRATDVHPTFAMIAGTRFDGIQFSLFGLHVHA